MKPFTRKLNLRTINEGMLLRDKTSKEYYVVLEFNTTFLHSHPYVKCLEVSKSYSYYKWFMSLNKIHKVKLYLDDLKDLEEVVL